MNKKITAVFLAMCILAATVAGCKKAEAAEVATEATEATAATTVETTEAAVESDEAKEEPEATEATTTTSETAAPEPKEPKLELDGNKKTKIEVAENSYYEGDRFVLYRPDVELFGIRFQGHVRAPSSLIRCSSNQILPFI